MKDAALGARQLEWPLAQERRRGGDYTALIAENHLTRQIYCEPFLHQKKLSLEHNFSVRLQVRLTVDLCTREGQIWELGQSRQVFHCAWPVIT